MQEEGLMLKPYLDPPHNSKGLYSIGYGHQIQPNEHALMAGITKQKALDLFYNDVAMRERNLTALIKRPMNQGQFDGILDFDYNEGDGAAAKVIQTWNETGSPALVAAHMNKYIYITQDGQHVVDRDLVVRRAYEAGLFTGLGHALADVASSVKKKAA